MNIIIPQNKCQNVDGTSFEGSSYFNILCMYYLSHKPSNNVCVIWGAPYSVDESKSVSKHHIHTDSCVKLPYHYERIPSEQTSVSLRWIEGTNGNESYISVPKPEREFWNNFLHCTDKRFVALPFGFTCKNFGHANYLLFDKTKKTLERFESFGKVDSECISDELIDTKIPELFRENLKDTEYADFTYIKPLVFLPEENVQTIQEEEMRWKKRSKKNNPVGFCSVWSVWYIDLRTMNPDIEPRTLVREAIKEIRNIEGKNGSFTDFIRRYSLLFVDYMKQVKKLYDGGAGGVFLPPMILDGWRKSRRLRKKSRSTKLKKRSLRSSKKKKKSVKKDGTSFFKTHKFIKTNDTEMELTNENNNISFTYNSPNYQLSMLTNKTKNVVEITHEKGSPTIAQINKIKSFFPKQFYQQLEDTNKYSK